MTPEQARRVALYVGAAWPGHKLSETSIALWADALIDLDAEIAMQAARKMVQEVPSFPSVAALRERADEIMRRPPAVQAALPWHPAPADPEERRRSPGLQSLKDVAETLKRRRYASVSSGNGPQSA